MRIFEMLKIMFAQSLMRNRVTDGQCPNSMRISFGMQVNRSREKITRYCWMQKKYLSLALVSSASSSCSSMLNSKLFTYQSFFNSLDKYRYPKKIAGFHKHDCIIRKIASTVQENIVICNAAYAKQTAISKATDIQVILVILCYSMSRWRFSLSFYCLQFKILNHLFKFTIQGSIIFNFNNILKKPISFSLYNIFLFRMKTDKELLYNKSWDSLLQHITRVIRGLKKFPPKIDYHKIYSCKDLLNECQVSAHITKTSENLLKEVVIIVLWSKTFNLLDRPIDNQRNKLNYEEEKGQYGTPVKRIVSLLQLSVICVSLLLFIPHKCQCHSYEIDEDEQAKEHENQLNIIEKGQFQG